MLETHFLNSGGNDLSFKLRLQYLIEEYNYQYLN